MNAKNFVIILVACVCFEAITANNKYAEQLLKKAWNKHKLGSRGLYAQRKESSHSPEIRTVDKTGTITTVSVSLNEMQKKSAPVARSSCGVPSTITEAEKADAVNKHNELRSGEGSSNMKKLTYNEDLANRAQEMTDRCHWDHALTSLCDGTPLGQNMAVKYNPWSDTIPDLDVQGSIQDWFDEKEGYNYDTGACSIAMCGHYTQVVWANSGEIGCGVTRCPIVTVEKGDPMPNAVLLTCNYLPSGNYYGQKPFAKGGACSECQSTWGTQVKCDNGLCATCEPGDGDCFCPLSSTCSGQGTFDSDACACVCNEGFYGDECEESCVCEDAPGYEWSCPQWTSLCSMSVYRSFLMNVCKSTCKFCNPPPGAC